MEPYAVAKVITGVYNTYKEGSAAIAGGCVRDKILGREVCDYDVFVVYRSSADLRELLILADRLGWDVEASKEYEGNVQARVRCVATLKTLGKQKVDVIFTNWELEDCIAAFPSSISQAWETGGVVHTTAAFDRTLKTKNIEFTSGEDCKHVQKMLKYFPDYKHTFINK